MAKVTFVTACMGRLAYLMQSLGHMVAQPDSEVIVVDYSCPQRCGNWVEANYPQVRVVRETGQTTYHQGRAKNLGARVAETPWLCFCDADIVFDPSFGQAVFPGLEARRFYRPDLLDDQGIWGTHLCMREDFERAGGFDEAMQGWGDSDLSFYDALEWIGSTPATFPAALLRHLSHTHQERTRFYHHKDRGVSLSVNRTYRYIKFDAVRLTGKLPTREESERLYAMVSEKVLASLNSNTPCTLTVNLPEGFDMPNRQRFERALTYRFHPAGNVSRVDSDDSPAATKATAHAKELLQAEQLFRAGKLDEMDQVCRSLLGTDPNAADAHRFLSLSAFTRGNLPEAEAQVRRAIEAQPDSAAAHDNLSLYLLRMGRPVEAEDAARQALAVQSDLGNASHNLGLALRAQGRFAEAEPSLRQALALEPNNAEIWNNLAAVLEQLRRVPESAVALERALQLRPDFKLARQNLQRVQVLLSELRRPGEGQNSRTSALANDTSAAAAENNLGVELLAQGRMAAAEAAFRRALLLAPDLAEISFNIGKALQGQERLPEAEEQFLRALRQRPEWADAHVHLGFVRYSQRRLTDAEAAYRRALELQGDHVEALNSLGANVLNNQGRVEEAGTVYRQALALEPAHSSCHSNLLLNEQYTPGATFAGLGTAHADWERRHAAPLRSTWKPFTSSRDPQRPLRLGFVSGDLYYHPVGVFLAPVLERLDRQQWFTACYASQSKNDELTGRLKNAAGLWRGVYDLSNEALAERIREDQIDLLFDLSGHTGRNRLLTFARRPAPVQLTWMGYVGTTGLSAIDYLVADRFHVPPDAEKHCRERVLRLPDSYLCFEPPAYAPTVGPLPALKAGHVTFGCFNNTSKITPAVVAVWAEIIRRVPSSRLVLKYHWLDDSGLRKRLAGLFAAKGIAADRLELLGSTPHVQQLQQYNRIDLALDSFPYSGGLTTLEACWMGVPVITCPGETFAGRHSFSYLSNIGLKDTIAKNMADYVALAVSLAGDLNRLSELRAGLRQRMAKSPVCDLDRFAGQFAVAMRKAWADWCARAEKVDIAT